jgi:CRP-like cAMP-binding protein
MTEVILMNFRPCYLFEDLTDDHVDQIISITKKITVKKGQRIFTEDEEATALYIIEEGPVELITRIEDDFEMPITILRNPGDCFGTSALIEPHVYSLSARSLAEGSLSVIERSALQKLMMKDHEVGCTMMRNLARHYLDRLKQTRQELRIHFRTLIRSIHS